MRTQTVRMPIRAALASPDARHGRYVWSSRPSVGLEDAGWVVVVARGRLLPHKQASVYRLAMASTSDETSSIDIAIGDEKSSVPMCPGQGGDTGTSDVFDMASMTFSTAIDDETSHHLGRPKGLPRAALAAAPAAPAAVDGPDDDLCLVCLDARLDCRCGDVVSAGSVMTHTDDIVVIADTDRLTLARVKDSAGIHDVVRSTVEGWRCSCPDECCHHVAAVRQGFPPLRRSSNESEIPP